MDTFNRLVILAQCTCTPFRVSPRVVSASESGLIQRPAAVINRILFTPKTQQKIIAGPSVSSGHSLDVEFVRLLPLSLLLLPLLIEHAMKPALYPSMKASVRNDGPLPGCLMYLSDGLEIFASSQPWSRQES